MNFESSHEFSKDVKRLAKKWRSIPNDIKSVEQYIIPLYKQLSKDVSVVEYRQTFFASKKAEILTTTDEVEVVKMRLDVADLGTSSKVRLVFVVVKIGDTVHFVELFAKNDKPREDPRRYRSFL